MIFCLTYKIKRTKRSFWDCVMRYRSMRGDDSMQVPTSFFLNQIVHCIMVSKKRWEIVGILVWCFLSSDNSLALWLFSYLSWKKLRRIDCKCINSLLCLGRSWDPRFSMSNYKKKIGKKIPNTYKSTRNIGDSALG